MSPEPLTRCEKCGRHKGLDVKEDPRVLNPLGMPMALCSACWFSTPPTYRDDRDCRGK